MVSLNDFKQEAECFYKNEHYSVRDNGAVLRHERIGKRLRKYDNQWTFGEPNSNGYMLIGSEVVHRIVAYAFLGEPPTTQHIVDHIDTNRQNNRPENLRWLTKLENILNNPITVKKIEFYCGSIAAYLKDPSILKNYVDKDRNFGWMRTVTSEEAEISWQRMTNWASKKSYHSTKNNSLGEWIFEDIQNSSVFKEISEFSTSETPNAVQVNWKTPSEFPLCPQEGANNPIKSYAENLKIGEIFSRNKYSNSMIIDFATAKDANTLWVMCKSNNKSAIKPWTLAQVTFEKDLFVHKNLGSFLEKIGAEKQFALVQGYDWSGENSIDDYM